MTTAPLFERIYAVVRQIPPGSVVSYGQVARIVGGISGQLVGYALAALPAHPEYSDVPWQRVINVQGKISPHGVGFGSAVQRQLLEEEGITFDVENRVDFAVYGWPLGLIPTPPVKAEQPQRKRGAG